MEKPSFELGEIVYAIFRKYKKYHLIGVITEISYNEHALDGWWISIIPTGNPKNDSHVDYLIVNRIHLLIPACDVHKIKEERS